MTETEKDMHEVSEARSGRTFTLVVVAMFAAAIAVCSWIAVPLPFTPVPINLGTLAVTLAGALLGKKWGTLSVVIYILLGAVGVPVFAGFTGGLSHIIGPTGGYIIGYITSAFICGLLIEITGRDDLTALDIGIASLAGTASCYLLGTLWFMVLTKTALMGALTMCVIPFIPGDIFKLIAAVVIVLAVKSKIPRLEG